MYNHKEKIVAFLPIEEIEEAALRQIENTATLPFLFKHVAVMPDTHFGKGATVGTVLPTRGAICPAAVGVDIGCGMIAVRTNLRGEEIKEKLHEIRTGLERRIPMSAGHNNNKILPSAQSRIDQLEQLAVDVKLYDSFDKNWRAALGTLGGGNHFIEVCVDDSDVVWLTLHSGSRGIGNKIGNHYIKLAQRECEAAFIQLPDRDLAYLCENTVGFDAYMRDLHWAQEFARHNRDEMMDRFIAEVRHTIGVQDIELERINCHHNFTQIEHHFGHDVWVTRKGAIEASEGKKAMIPGSMGTRSYIVSGLGCKMSFNSAPHGAGRRFSRGEARKRYTMEDFDKAMVGIEHRRTDVLLDEIPGAYKDIDHVMENARELVQIDVTLKQIMNCKGD